MRFETVSGYDISVQEAEKLSQIAQRFGLDVHVVQSSFQFYELENENGVRVNAALIAREFNRDIFNGVDAIFREFMPGMTAFQFVSNLASVRAVVRKTLENFIS